VRPGRPPRRSERPSDPPFAVGLGLRVALLTTFAVGLGLVRIVGVDPDGRWVVSAVWLVVLLAFGAIGARLVRRRTT
jgi:hypothetical protein